MIPASVQQKAAELVAGYIAGDVHARTLKCSVVQVIEVNYRWRLMCPDPEKAKKPDGWQLLSHESYNKQWRKR